MLSRLFRNKEIEDPKAIRFLFGNLIFAPLWTFARLYIGWQWLQAGWEKTTGDGWINHGGSSLQGFWTNAVMIPDKGRPAITFGWYRDFIQFMLDHHWYSWFGTVIAISETVIGVALILGAFTGLAALAGATMNFNFMLAGSASINPVLFLIAVLLILAWKTAGYIGLDRWLLPAIGTPWQAGRVVDEARGSGRPLVRPEPAAGPA